MKIAVVGAGHGGLTAAAEHTLAGHEVRLLESPEFAEAFAPVRERREITLVGTGRVGTARLAVATHDPAEALPGAEVVLVIAPSVAQESLARLCGPYLEDGQYIFLLPGGFGSWVFARTLEQMGVKKDLVFGESATLPYGARRSGPNEVAVHIRTICNPFAALPARATQQAAAVLRQLYPEIAEVENVLDVALDNTNPCVHPVPTLLSASRIEHSDGDFWLYREAMEPSTWRVMRAVDAERVTIREAFGLKPPHYELPEEVGQVFVGQFGWDGIEAGRQMKGPKALTDRYLTEDVPMGLVLYASLGRLAGVSTPKIDAVIELVSSLLGIDMWKTGRTLESLGLEGVACQEFIEQLA
jgi:opine dehydrogenase